MPIRFEIGKERPDQTGLLESPSSLLPTYVEPASAEDGSFSFNSSQ